VSRSYATKSIYPLDFARAVHDGLLKSPKSVPAQYLYDEVGSALFEAITVLPEYGLTRAEERLLRSCSKEVAWRLAPVSVVAELGSGTGRKTRLLLQAILDRKGKVDYCAIDVSATALDTCRRQFGDLSGLRVQVSQQSYISGLMKVRKDRPENGRLLVLFLGSSVGNFHYDEIPDFLKQVRRCLRPGDALLIGTDLVKKPDQLLRAYDDDCGVTAAFDLNLLARINRELDGNFPLRSFRHEARWRSEEKRIEMHLVSMEKQVISVPGADCRVLFEPGESIWTESSQKFDPVEFLQCARKTGFRPLAQWIDREWPFAENLWIADESI
jgi:L-histidine Nalpha-methyltransferase